eukprot:1659782-Amphidinium_carterae.2
MSEAHNGGSRAAEKMLQKAVNEKLADETAQGSNLERFFLMTQNCHSIVSDLVYGLPCQTTKQQAAKWTKQMADSVVSLAAKGRFGDLCILLDEIQVVTDEAGGRRKNTLAQHVLGFLGCPLWF